MPVYFDRQETQTPKSRDASLFRDLKGILSFAKGRAPALRDQLRGIDLSKLRTRADLAAVPVMRRSDLMRLQQEQPPLGGLAACRPGALKGVVVASPGPLFLPEGHAKDWWRAARAMNAAGFQRGDIVVNGFSFDRGAPARMVESGASALGCAAVSIGDAKIERHIEVLRQLAPAAYFGASDLLGWMLAAYEKRNADRWPIQKALCLDEPTSAAVEERFHRHGMCVHRCYATDEVGVIAYETKLRDGSVADNLVVNEGLIVEVVRPGAAEPLPFGVVGEVVVTRLTGDFPLLRFATGDLSALLPGPSPCGRTNLRLRRPLGRVDDSPAPGYATVLGASKNDRERSGRSTSSRSRAIESHWSADA